MGFLLMPFPVTMQMLNEAQTAYHSLMTGTAVVEVKDQNGESLRYAKADSAKLMAYIEWLSSQLGLNQRGSGPIGAWF